MTTKKALLIGCNYKGTSFELKGCINDTIQWFNILQDVYGFNESDIVFLRDDKADFKPTYKRIITELTNLVNQNADCIFIVYSGHGTSIPDMNSEEDDKLDECILPCDCQTSGVISDDILNNIFKNSKSSGLAIFDCCRSGTILDLPNMNILNTKAPETNIQQNNLICISGCKDSQTSAEIFNLNNMLQQGALTTLILYYLRKMKYYPTLSTLLDTINNDLKNSGLDQISIITSKNPIYNDTLFPLQPVFINSSELLNTQIATLTTQNKTLNTQVTSLTTQNRNLNTQNNSLNTQIATLTTQNKTLNTQIATLTTQNRNLNTQITTLTTQNRNLNTQIATLTTQNRNLNTQITTLTTKK
jgi:chaperonin cofactor prefoldin